MFEKDLRIPLLLDVYGELLTDRKREMMEYYYNEDYSLAEISEVTGISRQGVRDSIKKTVAELHELEDKLRMADRVHNFEACMSRVSEELTAITETMPDSSSVKDRLTELVKFIGDELRISNELLIENEVQAHSDKED